MKKLFLVLLIGVLMNSCTIHKGQILNLDYGQVVSISDQAIGTSSVRYFFGFGGNRHSVLLKEAKDNLIRNRPLKVNESYVNQNLNISTTYVLFYIKKRFTITADITSNKKEASIEKSSSELFNPGDSLISKSQKFKGIYVEKRHDSKIKVMNRKQVYQLLDSDKVYRKNGTYKGFEFNEKIKFKGDFTNSGQIKGFGTIDVIVLGKDNSRYIVKYSEISKLDED